MKRFTSIQHLRAIAAMMVVVFHLMVPARGIVFPAWTARAGASGVDIFFVISGFIIYISQTGENRGVADFIRRRLVRVLPLYWLFTALMIVLHVAAKLNHDLSMDPLYLLRSFLMVPQVNPHAPGMIEPALVVGWSLQYEIFFYGLFALGLILTPHRRVLWLSATLIALVGLGALFHPKDPIGASFTNPRLLEFLAGVLLGLVARGRPIAFPSWGWIAAPLGLLGLLATDWAAPGWGEAWLWGPLAVLIVAGALCLDLHGEALTAPLLKRLGDASYSIYLSHLITLSVVRQAWRMAVPASPSPLVFAAFALTAFIACAVVGLLVYAWIETPLLARLKTLTAHPRGNLDKTIH